MAESTTADAGQWVEVATAEACAPGELLRVEVGRLEIVIANVDGTLYALEDVCSHQDYPLSDGELDGTELECTFHGAKFDICSGKATQLPAIKAVRTFQVEDRGGALYVRV